MRFRVVWCPRGGNHCPQRLRATHDRIAREAGIATHIIQEQLGHERDNVTLDSYIGTGIDEKSQKGVLGDQREVRRNPYFNDISIRNCNSIAAFDLVVGGCPKRKAKA